MTASLDNAQINLHYLRDYIFDDFKHIFATKEKKSLVFEKDLEPNITLIVSTTQFNAWGVTAFHFLDAFINVGRTLTNNITFVIRKTPTSFKIVTDYMNIHKNLNYHIVVVPDIKYTLGINMLERADWLTKLTMHNLPIPLIPIDNDLLSMEFLDGFKEKVINHSNNYLFDAVDGIVLLEQLYGVIPVIHGIGIQAQFVVEEVLDNRHKVLHTESKIARMIIIDRTCDYITPLLTAITYAGALDEQIGIESNKIRFSMEVKNDKVTKNNIDVKNKNDDVTKKDIDNIIKKDIIIKANSDDKVYALIRDKRVEGIFDLLLPENKKYKHLYQLVEETKKKGDINGLNDAISKIKMLNTNYKETSLINHCNLLNKITIDYDIIEVEQNLMLGVIKDDNTFMTVWLSLLKKKHQVLKLFKLICLYCITNDGINVDFCKQLEHYIITYYDTDYVFLFDNLFTAGVLFPKNDDYKGRWYKARTKFQLIADDTNDIAYTFNGYAPLSCRLVENALMTPLNKLLGQKKTGVLFKGWMDKKTSTKTDLIDDSFYAIQETNLEQDNLLLVYFVGGITHAEIAALRYISTMNKDKHIIIATTCIINGNKMLNSLSKL